MEEFNLVEIELLIQALSNYVLRFPKSADFEEVNKLLEKLEQLKENVLKSGIEL